MPVLKMLAHPEGVFTATLYGISEDTSQHGPVFKWHWKTDEGDIVGMSSQAYSPKSRVREIAAALLGEAPEELDTDKLITRSCQIVVKKDGDYAKVTGFLPLG